MRYLIILSLSFLAYSHSFSQSIEELDRRNGFKDIKLNTEVKIYENLELKKTLIPQDTSLYQIYVPVRGTYQSIGSIPVRELKVRTYKGVVYDIEVVTKRDSNLYKSLEKAFGRPYNYNKVGYGDYSWKTENVRLTFSSHSKSKLALRYHSYALEAKLKSEKEENIQDISSDF